MSRPMPRKAPARESTIRKYRTVQPPKPAPKPVKAWANEKVPWHTWRKKSYPFTVPVLIAPASAGFWVSREAVDAVRDANCHWVTKKIRLQVLKELGCLASPARPARRGRTRQPRKEREAS